MFDEDDKIRRIYKETEFFEQGKFKSFQDDLNSQRIKIRAENVTEINIKCSGYGYF